VFLYAIGFVTGAWGYTTLDSPAAGSLGVALAVDLGLLGLFAVQHSVMARPAFKRWWTKVVPREAERSTYVLASNLALVAVFAFWRPVGGVVWEVEAAWARWALYGVGAVGWLLVLYSTFLINHFDLFGLRQVWLCLRGRPYTRLRFGAPVLYRYVRHPLYLGWFVAFWAAPTMTASHLLFAVMTAAYILTAIRLEERDLVAEHGESYAAYRRRTPMLVPFTRRRATV